MRVLGGWIGGMKKRCDEGPDDDVKEGVKEGLWQVAFQPAENVNFWHGGAGG